MRIRPTFFLDRLIRVQREQCLSVDELEHRQWQRFKKMLLHAAVHSPFYRRKFKLAGLEPNDVKDRDDLASIPTTSRDELASSEQFLSEFRDPQSLHESFSSGSTGQNVRTFFGDEAWLVGKYLLKLRARIACGVRPWDRVALIKAGQFHNSGFTRAVLRQQSFSIHEPPEQTLDALRRYSPTVIYGFPGYLSVLAEITAPDLRLKSIFTSGEMLSGSIRRKIEGAFAAPVYDVYGCTELKEVAWECPERSGYHINSDWLLVESLPSTVADEPDGMLAITSLYNFDMPLIRYRLGDTGRMLTGRCDCGRALPLMAPGFGRSMDYFQVSGGRLISPYTLSGAVELVPGVRQFQLRQVARDVVEVNVVPTTNAGPALQERLVAALQSLLPGAILRIKRVDAIPREPSGKYRKAVSLIAKETS